MAKKVSEVYQYADRLHQQGDLEKAAEIYEKIIIQCPTSRSAVMAKKRIQEIDEVKEARLKRARAAEKAEKKREKQQRREADQAASGNDKLEFFPFLSGTVLCAGIILPLFIHLIISHMAIFAGTTTTKVFFLSSTGASVIALILAAVGFFKCKAAGSVWQKRSLIWMIASGAATVIFFVLVILVQNQII